MDEKMFCFQCEETVGNKGCTITGICGKDSNVANLQDLLIYVLKGISVYAVGARELGANNDETDNFVAEGLFSTITNVNFDADRFMEWIRKAFKHRDDVRSLFLNAYRSKYQKEFDGILPGAATWKGADNIENFIAKGKEVGILAEKNEDIRSLRELLIYGLKGIAAYASHAYILGEKDNSILAFIEEALEATTNDKLGAGELLPLVMKAGTFSVKVMELLDKAHTVKYGSPEITGVFTGIKKGPAILVSGHDLLDLEEILKETQGKGINVYTHGEMLPANAYPELKKYKQLIGNYGTSWYNQQQEFDEFKGAIVMTTNCIQRPRASYMDRIFTTGLVGWSGITHIQDRVGTGPKDFSPVITKALALGELEEKAGKTIPIGFAHAAVAKVQDKIVEAVKAGSIKKFIVMAGCDGRRKERTYFTEVAEQLPKDTVILTAGCAKYRYNMLDLGDIGGIPRLIDAGQCNDSYSLVVIAKKLAEAFNLEDINKLPIAFDIAWYEQKAVCVLLALLSLGVKGIRLGPNLPAFISPAVLKILIEKFEIKGISDAGSDIKAMLGEAKKEEVVQV